MEYSLYINQLRAVEWGLNASEAIVFAYLSNATKLQSHPEYPDFLWLQNSKIMLELPLIIRHKDSAKKHMIKLEKLGLIDRFSEANKSYFRMTEKGALWLLDKPEDPEQPKGRDSAAWEQVILLSLAHSILSIEKAGVSNLKELAAGVVKGLEKSSSGAEL